MNVHHEMSDADVLRAAADSLSAIPVPSAPDTAAIITAGRSRRRQRMTVLPIAGTAAVTVAALGLSGAFGSASHQLFGSASHQLFGSASHQPFGSASHHPARAQLAAWTVARLADGNISVRINQFEDPAGLQSTLRADGVPASVTFAGQPDQACQPYPGGTASPGFGPPSPLLPSPLLRQVFPEPYQQAGTPPGTGPARMVEAAGPPSPPPSGNRVVIVIDPSALPSNAGVQLASANAAGTVLLLPAVVYASAQCTG
jgi:hypothetical protein